MAPATSPPGPSPSCVATLYAAPISLYSGKARAYLRYKEYPFEEVLPSMKILDEVIKPRTGLKMIPVLITPQDVAIQDTSEIIDHIEASLPKFRPVIPATPLQAFVSRLVELYADEWLLMPAMHYRWAHPREHLWMIINEFGEISQPHWPPVLRPLAGLPMTAYFGLGHGRVLGINATTRPEIERTYERFLGEFDAHLERHAYVLGERPTLADFGLIAPLYAHLYRDPVPGRLMRRLAPRVHGWVERMIEPEGRSYGELLAMDTIPETLAPILRHALLEHWPVIQDTWTRVEAHVRTRAVSKPLPRFLGEHSFGLGKARSVRAVQPYLAWFAQRMIDAYTRLDASSKEALRGLVGEDALEELERFDRPFELERVRGRVRVVA